MVLLFSVKTGHVMALIAPVGFLATCGQSNQFMLTHCFVLLDVLEDKYTIFGENYIISHNWDE